MAITTYAELKTAIANWLERSDLTSRIPEFISLAQSRMYHGAMAVDGRTQVIPPLRIRDMIATADITVTDGVGALPSGWLEFKRLWINDTDQPNLSYYPPQTFFDWAQSHTAASGEPVIGYTTEGSVLRIAPPNTETLKSVHYAKFTAMSADGDADWVLTNAPHVYLDGALAEAYGGYIRDAEAAAHHEARFSAAVRGLNAQYSDAQRAGSALRMRPRAIV